MGSPVDPIEPVSGVKPRSFENPDNREDTLVPAVPVQIYDCAHKVEDLSTVKGLIAKKVIERDDPMSLVHNETVIHLIHEMVKPLFDVSFDSHALNSGVTDLLNLVLRNEISFEELKSLRDHLDSHKDISPNDQAKLKDVINIIDKVLDIEVERIVNKLKFISKQVGTSVPNLDQIIRLIDSRPLTKFQIQDIFQLNYELKGIKNSSEFVKDFRHEVGLAIEFMVPKEDPLHEKIENLTKQLGDLWDQYSEVPTKDNIDHLYFPYMRLNNGSPTSNGVASLVGDYEEIQTALMACDPEVKPFLEKALVIIKEVISLLAPDLIQSLPETEPSIDKTSKSQSNFERLFNFAQLQLDPDAVEQAELILAKKGTLTRLEVDILTDFKDQLIELSKTHSSDLEIVQVLKDSLNDLDQVLLQYPQTQQPAAMLERSTAGHSGNFDLHMQTLDDLMILLSRDIEQSQASESIQRDKLLDNVGDQLYDLLKESGDLYDHILVAVMILWGNELTPSNIEELNLIREIILKGRNADNETVVNKAIALMDAVLPAVPKLSERQKGPTTEQTLTYKHQVIGKIETERTIIDPTQKTSQISNSSLAAINGLLAYPPASNTRDDYDALLKIFYQTTFDQNDVLNLVQLYQKFQTPEGRKYAEVIEKFFDATGNPILFISNNPIQDHGEGKKMFGELIKALSKVPVSLQEVDQLRQHLIVVRAPLKYSFPETHRRLGYIVDLLYPFVHASPVSAQNSPVLEKLHEVRYLNSSGAIEIQFARLEEIVTEGQMLQLIEHQLIHQPDKVQNGFFDLVHFSISDSQFKLMSDLFKQFEGRKIVFEEAGKPKGIDPVTGDIHLPRPAGVSKEVSDVIINPLLFIVPAKGKMSDSMNAVNQQALEQLRSPQVADQIAAYMNSDEAAPVVALKKESEVGISPQFDKQLQTPSRQNGVDLFYILKDRAACSFSDKDGSGDLDAMTASLISRNQKDHGIDPKVSKKVLKDLLSSKSALSQLGKSVGAKFAKLKMPTFKISKSRVINALGLNVFRSVPKSKEGGFSQDPFQVKKYSKDSDPYA